MTRKMLTFAATVIAGVALMAAFILCAELMFIWWKFTFEAAGLHGEPADELAILATSTTLVGAVMFAVHVTTRVDKKGGTEEVQR